LKSLVRNIDLNPWQNLIISFIVLISIGTVLLSTPWVLHKDTLSFIDSLFIATSAVCVTGLSTVSISNFTVFGEIILLFLMQLGAIGIMTLTSSFIVAIKGNIKLKQKTSYFKIQESGSLYEINHILRFILKITFISEFIGAILLTVGFLIQGFSFVDAVHLGIFHAISAFCNAGFSLFDNSMTGMNLIIKYTVMALIIIGGIGYYVVYELNNLYKSKRRLTLHTKIVLLTSILLIFLGALFIFFFEDGKISFTDSLFQSITSRTAGFNTVDLSRLSYLSLFFIILLMFIGASPGSTGGGIKTTTFFVVIISIIKILKGKTEIIIFNRKIPMNIVLKSFAVLASYFVIIFIGTLFLMYHTSYDFFNVLFEVTSAMGTVGLSVGVTTEVGFVGKLILIILMFVGRLGPASIAMITIGSKKDVKINYPEEFIY